MKGTNASVEHLVCFSVGGREHRHTFQPPPENWPTVWKIKGQLCGHVDGGDPVPKSICMLELGVVFKKTSPSNTAYSKCPRGASTWEKRELPKCLGIGFNTCNTIHRSTLRFVPVNPSRQVHITMYV